MNRVSNPLMSKTSSFLQLLILFCGVLSPALNAQSASSLRQTVSVLNALTMQNNYTPAIPFVTDYSEAEIKKSDFRIRLMDDVLVEPLLLGTVGAHVRNLDASVSIRLEPNTDRVLSLKFNPRKAITFIRAEGSDLPTQLGVKVNLKHLYQYFDLRFEDDLIREYSTKWLSRYGVLPQAVPHHFDKDEPLFIKERTVMRYDSLDRLRGIQVIAVFANRDSLGTYLPVGEAQLLEEYWFDYLPAEHTLETRHVKYALPEDLTKQEETTTHRLTISDNRTMHRISDRNGMRHSSIETFNDRLLPIRIESKRLDKPERSLTEIFYDDTLDCPVRKSAQKFGTDDQLYSHRIDLYGPVELLDRDQQPSGNFIWANTEQRYEVQIHRTIPTKTVEAGDLPRKRYYDKRCELNGLEPIIFGR